jgi:Protein of unknown function (DUF3987)
MSVDASPNKERKKKSIFLFRDLSGETRYRKRRIDYYENGEKVKKSWFERPAAGGRWVKGAPPDRYLYNVHRLVKAPLDELVYVVEGENKADALEELGLLGVCNDAGAGASKWAKEWAKLFTDRIVVILPDNDKPGLDHAQGVQQLLAGEAKVAAICELPELGPKEDVIEWLQIKGNDAQRLADLAHLAIKAKLDQVLANGSVGDAYEPEEDRLEEPEEPQPGWEPFPLELLPEVLRDYIAAAAEALVCDPAFIALPVLIAAGGVIGNSRVVTLKKTWREPAIYWGCVIADSSTLKSPALDIATAPLEKIERSLLRDFREAFSLWEQEVVCWENAGGKRTKEWAGEVTYPKPLRPPEGRLLISDITVEKVAELVSQNPKGLILCMDELAGWFSSFARYKSAGSGANDMPFWLSAHRGQRLRVDRKSGDRTSIVAELSAISVVGTLQPTIASRIFTRDVFDAGMVSRLLLVRPPKRPKIWSDAVIPDDVDAAYANLLRTLFFLDRQAISEQDYTPVNVHFTDAGLAAWKSFYGRWGAVQWDSEGEHASCLAKLEAYCARLALLLAEVEFHSGRTPYEQIDVVHVERAAVLVEWFSREATRVYRQVQTSAPQVERERLIAVIERKGGKITARDLLRSNPARLGGLSRCNQLLEELVSNNLGWWQQQPPGPKGGRPTRIFVLGAPDETDKTQPKPTTVRAAKG